MEVNSLAKAAPNYQKHAAETTAPSNSGAAETVSNRPKAEARTAQSALEAQIQDVKRAAAEFATPSQDSEALAELNRRAESSLLEKAIEQANKKLAGESRMLQYSVHEETHRVMIKVVDTDSDKVIREIPPEHTLDQFAKVLELAGLMVDKKR